ncbi:protein vein isoform X2 [Coccinella septempunctata]|uniref:protein vein isoform X2 n=1 Tax=Coccinella septempunctata TaxID=41139 RepID=UPI001D075F91|nr:protein vein isoform X2 [Coccinella septempunctata]
MYGISYEKCICFIFLVILAFLSCCSGFRIDSLTMTDISRRNLSLESLPPENDFMNRIYATARLKDDDFSHRHRIRHHHRSIRAQNNDGPRKIRRNRPRTPCPKQDISQKAFLANTVVVARTEAVSVRSRTHKYSVLFKVQRKLKSPSAFPLIDEYIQLYFLNDTSSQRTQLRCVSERNPSKLVRANIQQSREYLLFLNSYGAHNYTAIGPPEPIRKHKLPKVVQKVINPNFRIRPPRVMEIEDKSISASAGRKRRLKLICRSRGLPIPTLSWSRNGTDIHPNHRIRITYKKRSSTLLVTEPSVGDHGRYVCTARGVSGKPSSAHFDFRENSEATDRPCEPGMAKHYCFNGGTCRYLIKMQELYCLCPDGYTGHRCDSKLPSQSSMYPSTPSLYTCKMGLSTRYFC